MKNQSQQNMDTKKKYQVDFPRKLTEKFCFSDQLIRVQGVFKRLLAVDQDKKVAPNTLPLCVSVQLLEYNLVQCQFYEPLSSNLFPLDVEKINLNESLTTPQSFIHTSCKFGWLFFSIINPILSSTSFMLYSLSSKEVIRLPTLVDSTSHHSRFVKAFSTFPDSADCVFLVLDYNFDIDHRVTISTCRRGDKEWTIREFDRADINYMCFGTSPVYIRGVFYFVSSAGEVGSYNVANGEWKAERNLFNDIIDSNMRYRTFEFNGELVLIFFYDNVTSNESGKFGYMRLFDWSSKVWVRLKSLENQALFVSRNTFLVSEFGNKARENGILPDRIYRLVEDGCIVYSIKNGDLVDCKKVNNYRGKSVFWVEPPPNPLAKQIEER